MKRSIFTLFVAIFAFLIQVKAETKKVNYVFPSITTDLSLKLVTTFRTPTPYAPGIGTNVRLLPFGDGDGFYSFTPRYGDTYVPVFGYSPYAMCDYKVMKVEGYYNNCNYSPCRMYVWLSVVISGTTYYMYWPAYRENSITDYTNFLQAA